MNTDTPTARFNPGRLLITPGAAEAFSPSEVMAALADHLAGGWGDICPEDKQTNEDALETGARLMSTYTRTEDGTRLWIITEAEDDQGVRAATTALLPEEY